MIENKQCANSGLQPERKSLSQKLKWILNREIHMPEDRLVIWPAYFDLDRSRDQGRRVATADAVRNPKLEDIIRVSEDLGLDPVVEREKCYPKSWYDQPGRVLVLKKGSKTKTLRSIARALKKRRS
ncbi:MAG: signal recognition particle protein Srp19 [Methanothrix sp.]|uniref:signal recognition particle protein Srp19 n=1 Tax=Methanothrix sp. TaxID=90426 RepID=UPI0032B023AE|nr:signal recognition particle protein Srp19 [Methanothrix sp.]